MAENPRDNEPDAGAAPAPEAAASSEDLASRSLTRAATVSFGLLRLFMGLVALLFLADCVQFVDEGSIAIKERFGRAVRDEQGRVIVYKPTSDFVFVLPYPMERLRTLSLRTETIDLGGRFWPKIDKTAAILDGEAIPATPSLDPEKGGYCITGDRGLAHSRWQLEYRIVDPLRALKAASGDSPEEVKAGLEKILRAVAAGAITRNLAGLKLDQALTGEVSARILEDIRAELEGARFGLAAAAINNSALAPPGIAQPAFEGLSGAVSERVKLESEARAEAARIVEAGEAEAREVVFDAEVYRRRVVAQTLSDAKALEDLLARFPNDPEGLAVYLRQRRQDRLRQALERANLYLMPPGQRGVMQVAPSTAELGDGRAERAEGPR